jgi:peptidoglycan/xylan/chitin deacetylase (PgdA/CDA1 family)
VHSLNLLYHRVNQLEPDPWTLCVSPAHFAEHLEVVCRLSPRPTVTFDDGYWDNLSNALPILEAHDVEAHFFITSGAVGRTREMWWDALDHLYAEEESYQREYLSFRLLSSEEQERELDAMFAARGLSRRARPARRMLSESELVRLAAHPLAIIGAHTVTHPVLSQLCVQEQEEEIRKSKQSLEALVGYRLEGFSYPNGMETDYTTETIHLVQQAGFTYAYSAFERTRTDAFQLPRTMIRDWDGDEFERRLYAATVV